MKTSLIFAALAVASTVSAYNCPSTSDVNEACRSININPLVCNNPQVNVEACNAKQCNQVYIDNYSACQCLRSSTMFDEHLSNVEGLLQRCSVASLTNPFGEPGTRTAILQEESPTSVPVAAADYNTDYHISGGSIAGIVLGLLAITGLAGLLGFFWRKKRHAHMSVYHHYEADPESFRGVPSRTVVSEKIEPVVIRTGGGGGGVGHNQNLASSGAGVAPASTSYNSNNNTATGSSTHLPSNNTTTNPVILPTQPNPYTTQPRTGADGITHHPQ